MKRIFDELVSGFTVAIVALPLALAFGVAATGTPEGAVLGLYGAIFTGFFASILGGTPAQVTGPTGPITVVITNVIIQFGIKEAFLATVMAGLIQILLGFLKAGTLIKYIKPPVVSGFMNGIAIIIILTQVEELERALLLVLLTIGIMLLSGKVVKNVPASLSALVVGSIFILLFKPYFPHTEFYIPFIGDMKLVDKINFIGQIPKGIPEIFLPSFEFKELILLLPSAFAIALLSSIDSLLTSVVMDNITGKKHNSNKELIGQGVGNFFAGLFGGLPGAGATVRSVVNVKCGARTWISGAFHAIVLLSFMLLLNNLVSQIPLAVLGGILIVTGFSMFDYDSLKKLKTLSYENVIMITTMILTVTVDLMVAVAIGVILTLAGNLIFKPKEEIPVEIRK